MTIIDIFLENPLGQSVGIVAMLILFYGLSQKDDSKTLKIIMISLVFWIIHYLLMGVYSGIVGASIGIIRTFLSLKFKYNKYIFTGLIITTIILGYFTYQDLYSLLPIIASCIGAYGYFFLEKIKLRIFMMITSSFWFTYSVGNGLIGGIINEVIVQGIIASCIGAYGYFF